MKANHIFQSFNMRIRIIFLLHFILFSVYSFGQTVDFEFSEVCVGGNTSLTSTSTSLAGDPIILWGWDLTNNGEFTDASGEVITHNFSQSGTYLIGLKIITQSGFSEAFYQDVLVGSFPVANFTYENACASDFTSFINLSTLENENLEDFIWDFGDGVTNNFEASPEHWYASPGFYSVKLIALSNLGCNDTITRQVNIHSVPVFNFEYSGSATFNEGESLVVNAVGDFDQILWSTGSTTTSITITTGGYYFAEVRKDGCPSFQSFTVIVHDKVGITNLITPNGDGYNDYWEILHIENHSPCQVSIFSREGNLIYSSTNYNNRWSGTFNGMPLPEGTYYYVVKCSEGLEETGALSIIR